MNSHLAAQMGHNFLPGVQLYSELRIRQSFRYFSLNLNRVILSQRSFALNNKPRTAPAGRMPLYSQKHLHSQGHERAISHMLLHTQLLSSGTGSSHFMGVEN